MNTARSVRRFFRRFFSRSLLVALVGPVACFAASSPMTKWLTDLNTEATTTWAYAGAGVGLVIGFLMLKFGRGDHKGTIAGVLVAAFLLLSVPTIISYLAGE